jgi:hypothetical protein
VVLFASGTMGFVYVRIWEYDVAAEQADDFESVYGADGDWARLFAVSEAYRGTDLYACVGKPARYLTVDRFATEAAWQEFLDAHGDAYRRLDDRTAHLTIGEREITATSVGS